MRALLDVNVLIALHDRDHVHHERAALWLEDNIAAGWASCPLTQNGCLRIMSQAGYSSPQPLAVLIAMLQGSVSTAHHSL
jgi:predicted nucleic acid-binding protein